MFRNQDITKTKFEITYFFMRHALPNLICQVVLKFPFLQQVSNWIYTGKTLAGGPEDRNIALRIKVQYRESLHEMK